MSAAPEARAGTSKMSEQGQGLGYGLGLQKCQYGERILCGISSNLITFEIAVKTIRCKSVIGSYSARAPQQVAVTTCMVLRARAGRGRRCSSMSVAGELYAAVNRVNGVLRVSVRRNSA